MRAMVPSSFTISQITPAGYRPARRAEVDRGLGLTAALQDSARPRAQRKDMPGPREILRATLRIYRRLDGSRPIMSRNTGRDAKASRID
jgi:hypothetical protein